MSGKSRRNTEVESAGSSDEAKELLSSALQSLRDVMHLGSPEDPRLFFPNGIEHISITIKVARVELVFKVAGEKGVALLDDGTDIGADGEGATANAG